MSALRLMYCPQCQRVYWIDREAKFQQPKYFLCREDQSFLLEVPGLRPQAYKLP